MSNQPVRASEGGLIPSTRPASGLGRRRAVETLEPRLMLFAVPIHIELTTDALPFLNAQTVAAISAEHVLVDTAGAFDPDNHMDSCHFVGGVENINTQLADAVADADPAALSPTTAAGNFGHELHTAEDLYAHSSWVNDGQTTLFDDGGGFWKPVTPYEVRDGIMVVEGPLPADTWSVSRDGLIVHVDTGSQVFTGVVTGQFDPTPADCPPGAVITHAELNKDDETRPLFAEAKALAVRQVRHEFYRLVQLVKAEWGTAQPLLDAWVKPDAASQQQLQALLGEETPPGSVDAGGVLTLNMGPNAGGADGNEAFAVSHVSGSPAAGGEVVDVTANGVTRRFSVTAIVADGGAGDDALTLTGVRSAVRFAGGGGADALTVAAPAGTAGAAYTVAPDRVSAGAATTDFTGVERLTVRAADGPDSINVRGTAAGVAVTVDGGGGDDAFSVDSNGPAAGGTVDLVRGPLTVAGGAGRNALVLEDSSDTTADVVTVTPTAIGTAPGDTFFGPGGSLAYSGLAGVALDLPNATAGDSVRLTPSATTAFAVNGGRPSGAPAGGDVLLIDTTGTTGRKKKAAGKNAGVWTFGNRLPVAYADVEKVKEAK